MHAARVELFPLILKSVGSVALMDGLIEYACRRRRRRPRSIMVVFNKLGKLYVCP